MNELTKGVIQGGRIIQSYVLKFFAARTDGDYPPPLPGFRNALSTGFLASDRRCLAWPRSIDDAKARAEWSLTPAYSLAEMVDVNIKNGAHVSEIKKS